MYDNGPITGKVIDDPTPFSTRDNGNTLDGIVLHAVLTTYGNGRVTISNGQEFNDTATINAASSSGARYRFEGLQTLSGTSTINFTDSSYNYCYYVGDTTLTIGPESTIDGGRGNDGQRGVDQVLITNGVISNFQKDRRSPFGRASAVDVYRRVDLSAV